MKYYDQKDSVWATYPFNTSDKPIGKTGCGVTALAMIYSSIRQQEITPIENADYAIEWGCDGYTKRQFFTDIVKNEKYKLCLKHFIGGNSVDEVKEGYIKILQSLSTNETTIVA